MNWGELLASWDHQQAGYMANREERFDVICDALALTVGEQPRVLDLCSGPGSLSHRILARLPQASIFAVDADPVLQLLGRRGRPDERITWLLDDLRDPDWEKRAREHGSFDAVVSTTALHWLGDADLVAVYSAVGRLTHPGSVVVNGDHLYDDPSQIKLRILQAQLRKVERDDREDYRTWWSRIAQAAEFDDELRAAFAARGHDGSGHSSIDPPPLELHITALRAAGFPDVGTIWQHGDDRVLVAMR